MLQQFDPLEPIPPQEYADLLHISHPVVFSSCDVDEAEKQLSEYQDSLSEDFLEELYALGSSSPDFDYAQLVPIQSKPPVSNTGVILEEGVYALIDWVRGTMSQTELENIFGIVERFWGQRPEQRDRGLRWYHNSAKGLHSVLVCWNPTTEGRSEMSLDIPGAALAALDVEKQRELFQALAKIPNFRCRRIDPAIRDYTRTVCPLKAREAYLNGQVKGFKKRKLETDSHPTLGDGHTTYFGRRGSSGSGKLLRIYDKYVQSDGRDNCIVCELELTDHKAEEFWNRLVSWANETGENEVLLVEMWPSFIAHHIKGAIQFVDCDWWQQVFNGDLSAWKLPAKKKNDVTIQKMSVWFKKQVAPTFSVLVAYLSRRDSVGCPIEETAWYNWLMSMLLDGESRWQERHKLAYYEAIAT